MASANPETEISAERIRFGGFKREGGSKRDREREKERKRGRGRERERERKKERVQ